VALTYPDDGAFELRHAMLFGAYFFDRDEVVGRIVPDPPLRRTLEHTAFLVATLIVGVGASLCTHSDAFSPGPEAYPRNGCLGGGRLYAIGLSTLAPRWGCVALDIAAGA